LALTTLTACETSGGKVTLAPIPGDIKACFDKHVRMPPAGALTRQQVFRLVADFKKSEAAKSACGKRLIHWYETQATVFAGQK
jgi:hypothetical protein